MPLYQFQCEHCGSEFDLLCSIADKEEKRAACPSCGATELRQRFTRVAVRTGACPPSCSHDCSSCGGCGG